ncbi:MAG: 1,4-alpha-glucan branching protein domain-containing protein [Solirubrobacteraceae bacterium]|nr:DUF1957 domain-containing protein [Patulibacter sp.]
MSRPAGAGSLAIVLHTHMPYVHGYGTWPFGEEWLWEVYGSSYLPVSALAEQAPLTVSLTPVVGDQLEAPGAAAACEHFLDVVRRGTHDEDRHWLSQKPDLAGMLTASEHSWAHHERALAQVRALEGDLLAPLAAVSTWTSAATHAVLPLVATEAGVRLQVGSGENSHRRRTGRWGGGFWLPECAWDPELEGPLLDEGVRTVCAEVPGAPAEGLVPWRTASGLRILPIDRPLIDAIWHHTGYPGHAAYRDTYRRSFQNHNLWANGGEPYDAEAGAAQARAHAAEWAALVAERTAGGRDLVVAFDTELFGHWWHEGPLFLEAAVEALAAHGVELVQADDLVARLDADGALPVAEAPAAGTWGRGRDLRTWSGTSVAPIAWELRRAELDLLVGRHPGEVGEASLRDLLALQASDWAFMVAEDRTPGYAWSRFAGHRLSLTQPAGSLPSSSPRLRHLAPDLAQDALAVG